MNTSRDRMNTNGGPSRSRNVQQPTERNLLAKVHIDDLKLLRVAVRRGNITSSASAPQPMERGIDDPAKIVPLVHFRKDGDKIPKPPIFDKNIKVNQEFNLEERWVLADANRLEKPTHSPSKSRSSSRSRSQSPHYVEKRRVPRSRSPSRRSRSSRTPRRSTSRGPKGRRSRSIEQKRVTNVPRQNYSGKYDHEAKQRAVESSRDKERYNKVRSRSPSSSYHTRPSEGSNVNDRYERKSKSPTPLRPGEYRPNHPDLKLRKKSKVVDEEYLHERYRSRRSRSLSRDRRGGPTHKSQSPYKSSKRGESRSPYREKDVSPPASRSARKSRSPPRTEKAGGVKYFKGHVSPRQRSRSPVRKDRRSRSPGGRKDRRSRSPGGTYRSQEKKSPVKPYYKRHSRSPSRYDTKRRSRSPSNYRSREREYRRSRSPHSKHYYKGRSPSSRRRSRTPPAYHGEHSRMEYPVYDPEYWGMPGPIRPGFPPPYPRFYPPLYPRGIIPPGAPMMIPRMPMMPHYQQFPRLPLPNYNSGAVKPKIVTPAIKPSATITSVDVDAAKGETSKDSSKTQKAASEKTGENADTEQKHDEDDDKHDKRSE